MSNELAVQYDAPMMQWRDPETVLSEAMTAAQALGRVIALKKSPVVFNGEQYLELEDWQTVGKFYGITTKVVETRYVEYGGVTGWEAIAVGIDKNGVEVSRAESMCMSDEANWGAVPVYEYKDILDKDGKKVWVEGKNGKKGYYKAEKVQVGTAAKPQFQLRSMAQTRACGKAFRQVLSWVVVLGGFKPNVAEEMIEAQLGPSNPNEAEKATKAPVQQPRRASEKAAETKQDVAEDAITITGIITSAKAGGKDGNATMWLRVGDYLMVAKDALIHDEMIEGNHLSVKGKKYVSDKVGTYYGILEVLECSSVVNAEVEDPTSAPSATAETQQKKAAEPVGQVQTDKAAEVDWEYKPDKAEDPAPTVDELVASGAVTKGSNLADAAAKKEAAWKAHEGHDPAKHISFKQGNLLFKIQGGRKLSDDVVHDVLMEEFGVEHRYHILKEDFGLLLDILDPDFQFHEKK